MKLIERAFLICLVIFATGCSTMADSVAAKGTGPYRIYEKPKEEVWPVALEAISSSELELVSANEDSGTILAQRGITAFSYGANVAMFVEVFDEGGTRVEVVSKRAMETNVFEPNWAKELFRYLDSRLK